MDVSIGDIGVYIAQILALGIFTWGSMKGITSQLDKGMGPGKARKRTKFVTAQLIGPLLAISAYGMGFLATPTEGVWSWIGAAIFGYAGSITASSTHNFMKKPVGKLPR
jgi:hypothetical protein